MTAPDPPLARYHRQMLLPGIGEAGQRRLAAAHALVVGCGALGTVVADLLARAGVGRLTIVDRDIVELTNLQRQTLFDEADAVDGVPKAVAAERRLRQVNSSIRIDGVVADFSSENASRLAADADVLLDGLDNFDTRYLLNDLAVSRGVPYCYGGAVSTTGLAMSILPRGGDRWPAEFATPCLRCLFPEAPPPGASPTCDTAGVLGSATFTIAAHQATQAIKMLVGDWAAVDRSMISLELWSNEFRRFEVGATGPAPECACCGRREFTFLNAPRSGAVTSLCGRGAMQVAPGRSGSAVNLAQLGARLRAHGSFSVTAHLVRGVLERERGDGGESVELTVFRDGRAVFKGVTDATAARSLYSRYVGD